MARLQRRRSRVRELAQGVYSLGHGKGGHVHAFLIENGGELIARRHAVRGRRTSRARRDPRGSGGSPSDLKRIAITHGHRSHLGGLAALKRASGATVYAHAWEADIVSRRPARATGQHPAAAVAEADSVPTRALARPPEARALPRRRAPRGRRRIGPAAGAPRARPLARTPGVRLARAAIPDRRRRGRDLAGALRRLERVQPQQAAAPAHPAAARRARRDASSASVTATRLCKVRPRRCTSSQGGPFHEAMMSAARSQRGREVVETLTR